MTGIYVLLMLFGTGWRDGGLCTIQQEFASRAACEAAFVQMQRNTTHNTVFQGGMNATNIVFQSGGCFQK